MSDVAERVKKIVVQHLGVDAEKVVEYVWRMKAEMQSIFCNTVAQSSRVSIYVTLANFGKMLAAHKIFFSTK